MGTAQRLIAASLILGMLAGAAHGYVVPVEDLGALAQHLLVVAQTAKSNINEALLIKQQFDQYLRMVDNLQRIPVSMVNQIQNAMRDYRNLLSTANAMSYDLAAIDAQFATLQQQGITLGNIQIGGTRQAWTQQMMDTARMAVKVQAIQNEQEKDQARVGTALSMSDSAQGNLDVTQASNQLLALLAKQQAESLQLQATGNRMQTLQYGRWAAGEQAAQQRMDEWLQRDTTAIPDYRPPGQTSDGLPMPKLR